MYLKYCNCVLYYMPRFNDDIVICGRSQNNCVNDVTRLIQLRNNASFICECLPGCFAVNYDTEVSMSPLLLSSPWLQENKMMARNTAIVHVYYKDVSFRSQRKEQLIGFTEFLCRFFFTVFKINETILL